MQKSAQNAFSAPDSSDWAGETGVDEGREGKREVRINRLKGSGRIDGHPALNVLDPSVRYAR